MSSSEGSIYNGNIVVMNGQTVIDEDAMWQAIGRIESACAFLESAVLHSRHGVGYAANLLVEHPMLGWGVEMLSHVKEEATKSRLSLEKLKENIGMVLLLFYAAENRAKEFFSLRAQMYPSALAFLDVAMETSTPSLTPWGKRSETLRERLPSPYSYDFVRALVGFIPFALAQGGDPSDLATEQIHLERASQGFTQLLIPLPTTRRLVDGTAAERSYRMGRGSWWVGDSRATAQASSVMAAFLFNYGRFTYGQTVGVGIIGNVEDKQGTSVTRTGFAYSDANPTLVAAGPRLYPWYFAIPRVLATAVPAPVGETHPYAKQGVNSEDLQRLKSQNIPVRPAPPPHNPSATIKRIANLEHSKDYGQIEVLKHTTPKADGGTQTSWSVIIRGTQKWDGGGSNPQDLLSNFQGVAGEDNDQSRAVRLAMEAAGIAPGEAVEFVGHSQGGIVATQMAADAEISQRYTVASVLTAGSPSGRYSPETQAGMLNLENTRDLVPALDSRMNNDGGNNTTVFFDGAFLDMKDKEGNPRFSHDIDVYARALEDLEHGSDPRTQGVHQWVQRRNEALGLNEHTTTLSFVFNSSRLHAAR